ncbi:MAG: hypothetical protein ABIK32_04420 [Chloroflexota bacterium]|nr:hypothetical protein [Chloroflexota bacterium]
MLESIINRVIDYIIVNLWDDLTFLRITSIVLFVFLVLIYTFKNRLFKLLYNDKHQTQTHDINIFNESDQLLNEEQFTEYYDTLGINRVISGQSRRVDAFLHFFKEEGNQYLDNRIRKYCIRFVKKLDALSVFVATHFFMYPNNQSSTDMEYIQSALYPEVLHGSSKTPEYQHAIQCQHELHSMLDEIFILYRNYRRLVKKKLQI